MDKELQNLYVVARRAREDFNSRLAAQYYDRILQKQPMSWEAYFYATYFSLCTFTILEIPRTAQTMRKCLGNTFALIRDHVEDEAEQNAAVCEAASSCQALASMLDGGAVLYYQHLDPGKQQRFQDVFQMSRIEVAYFLRDLGDLANRVFEERMDLKGHALEAWWTVVKRMDHLGQMIGYSKEARELISSMEQRMQSTRAAMPAFPYPAGTP